MSNEAERPFIDGIGIPLEEQRARFSPESLDGASNTGDLTPEISERAIVQAMSGLTREIEAIKTAPNLAKLLQMLIIINVNEFKYTEHPTEAEFLDILNDHDRYTMGYRQHFTGPREEEMTRMLEEKAHEAFAAAKVRYDELTKHQ